MTMPIVIEISFKDSHHAVNQILMGLRVFNPVQTRKGPFVSLASIYRCRWLEDIAPQATQILFNNLFCTISMMAMTPPKTNKEEKKRSGSCG